MKIILLFIVGIVCSSTLEKFKLIKRISKKFKKQRDLNINNPQECYLTMHLFPMQYYTEIFKTEFRVRFFGNCNKTKDIVFSFNKQIPMEIINDYKIHLEIFSHPFIIDFNDKHEHHGD